MPAILHNHSLRDLNTFHLEARAESYCECRSVGDLMKIISGKEYREYRENRKLQESGVLVLGGGSNILFSGDFGGLVIRPLILGRETIREDRHHVWVRAGAGENWDDLVAWTTAWGLGGLENLSLIPGAVGSAPIQNIGAYGAEVGDHIHQVEAVDTLTAQRLTFTSESCHFAYRDSIFKREWKGKCIISTVTFRLDKKPVLNTGYPAVAEKLAARETPDVENMRQVILEIRRSKLPDPAELGNAGSFFKNPVVESEQFRRLAGEFPEMPSYPVHSGARKIPAAWLIEQCGWKGKRLGDAGTYEKQPLVLVNYGRATGRDILELSSRIERDVSLKFGIQLDKEVNVV